MRQMIQGAIVGGAAAVLAGCGAAAPAGHGAHRDHGTAVEAAPTPAADVTPYPLDTCIVSGEPLGGMGEAVVRVHEGREIKFCCEGCIGDFEADPATYLAKLPR